MVKEVVRKRELIATGYGPSRHVRPAGRRIVPLDATGQTRGSLAAIWPTAGRIGQTVA
jgi:hypothetical protein